MKLDGKHFRVHGNKQPIDVMRVLVFNGTTLAYSLVKFVELGYQQGARPSHQNPNASGIGWIKCRDLELLVANQRRFKSSALPHGKSVVRRGIHCPPPTACD